MNETLRKAKATGEPAPDGRQICRLARGQVDGPGMHRRVAGRAPSVGSADSRTTGR